ncbi:MAG: dihydrolipoyl dehydrogenase [Candidatus Edwardsbacteria bacterium]|nr:dihydrolipoyl dehydrogenase [Candidatus Edwardsbacteria bacterium]
MDQHIVIIGGGPAGYVGAIRAAQLGARVTVIEKSTLGGTCLNVGCIPTKALLASASVMQHTKAAGQFGIKTEGVSFNWADIQKRKDRVVKKATAGVGMLLKAKQVEVIKSPARLSGRGKILLEAEGREIGYDKLLIATGSQPVIPPIPGIDLPGVLDSTGALALDAVPESLLIIGGGVIGCEMAEVYSTFGSRVTIVEMMPQLIPGEDPEAVEVLYKALIKKGVDIKLDSRVNGLTKNGDLIEVEVAGNEGGKTKIKAARVLVSVGRKASIQGLGLEEAGIAIEKGCIKVNGRMETNIPGVYAAGDCIGGWLLAHVASREAEIAVENMLGPEAVMEYHAVPRCVYTHPEIASAGIPASPQADKNILTGKFPFSASGKASCIGELEGFVKILADRETHQLLGCVIAGPAATELISEASLAISSKLRLEDVIQTVHSHPTLHESFLEAALNALGRAIHLS